MRRWRRWVARSAVVGLGWTWAGFAAAQAAGPMPDKAVEVAPATPADPRSPAPPVPAAPPTPAAPVAAPAPPDQPTPAPAPEPVAPPPAPPAAAAEQPSSARPWPTSAHAAFVLQQDARRHLGFSFRLSAALGLASAGRDLKKGEQQISGFDAGISLDLGATPIENLVVFGRIGGFAFDHASSSDSPNVATAFVGLVGPGARYYFMPVDWYVGGVLALAAVSVNDTLGNSQNAGVGFGLELETGKNWFAGSYRDRWTIGLGLRFDYARSGPAESMGRDKSSDPWQATALSVVFSIGSS